MLERLEERFRRAAPAVDFCSLRYFDERTETLSVRQDVTRPVSTARDVGVMIAVLDGGGAGWAATGDLSESGLRAAARLAHDRARSCAGRSAVDYAAVSATVPRGEYRTPTRMPWSQVSLGDRLDLLRRESGRLRVDARIVDWEASLWRAETETVYLTNDGGRVCQHIDQVMPSLVATASEGVETQVRTLGGHARARQGGFEVLEQVGFFEAAPRIGAEAVQLLAAPDCPSDTMDVLLAPDQMILQIHESIGHPLELDRILGDERNYAGTSFVTLDMFGSYQYGSALLNVTCDPERTEQLASYGYDDDGTAASRTFIIQDGVLLRPLGGHISQCRAGIAGAAVSRASGWNRIPIDRMANLNLEPGESTLDDMIRAVERGVYLSTNTSWSIDDSRNKFQFGCEWGRLIVDGRLGDLVKTPNYRGVSSEFWRSLKMVGDVSTFEVMGTPYCGKGEPNQMVRVGHASPACLFSGVRVFGGE